MSRLFEPLALGVTTLDHRVAMAPLTRYRMDDDWNATALSKGKFRALTKSQDIPLIDRGFRVL